MRTGIRGKILQVILSHYVQNIADSKRAFQIRLVYLGGKFSKKPPTFLAFSLVSITKGEFL